MPRTEIDIDQVRAFYGALQAVRVVVTTNVTLSGLQDLAGDTGADGHRVLLIGQTTTTETGIWVMRTGAWERAPDAIPGFDLGGMLVPVTAGDNAGKEYRIANQVGAGVVGTDAIAVTLQSQAGGIAQKQQDTIAQFQTSSTDYVDTGLQIVTAQAGEIDVFFAGQAEASRANRAAAFVVTINGTPRTNTELTQYYGNADAPQMTAIADTITVAAGDTVKVQTKRVGLNATLTITNGTLKITF